jgi:malonate-semialdehyde dehydrogenase (acetylating) / methylmalonate-semialdehyde dehydrogenase
VILGPAERLHALAVAGRRLCDVTRDGRGADETHRADSYAEALEIVNANPYGNGTAIFTNDGGAARRFTHEVEVGMVGVNVPIPVPMAFYSFGGWKSSLFGDTHVHGTEGVHFYTRGKAVTSRWLDPSHGGVNLGFPVNQ